jgi:hypothetical protein
MFTRIFYLFFAATFMLSACGTIEGWQDTTHFKTGLRWTCLPQNNNPSGIYLFDLAGRQIIRIGDLPNP